MATWYVATTGSDTNSGTGPASPLRNIMTAVGKAVNGDTIEVAGTTGPEVYSESINWSKALTFRAAAGPRPVLDGGGTQLYGFITFSSTNCRIEGFEIRHYRLRGIHAYGPGKGAVTNLVITNNHIHHIENNNIADQTAPSSAMYIVYGNPTITNNICHHIRGTNESIGVWLLYCNNHVFDHNTVFAIRKEAIRDYLCLSGTITNNFFFLATTGWAGNESAAALVANNYIGFCMMGVNPKHSNDPFSPADSTQYQNSVLYVWGLTEQTVPNWCRVYHNTIYRCSWGGFTIAVNINPDGVSGYTNQTDIRNNLLTGPAGPYIWDAPQARTANFIVDYDVFDTTAPSTVHLYEVLYTYTDPTTYKDTLAQIRTDLGWEVHGQQAAITFANRDQMDLTPTSSVPTGAALPTAWGTQVGARGLVMPAGVSYQNVPMTAISSRTTTQSSPTHATDHLAFSDYIGNFPSDEWIVFDAGSSVTLNTLTGYNAHHFLSYNPKDIALETGTSSTGPWTNVMSGTILDSGGTAWPFDWPDATSRYWRFRMLTNHGHATWTVLSEIEFGRFTSPTSDSVSAPVDTTAPTVTVTAPSGGTSVSGGVTITATAADNIGVAKVEFYVDGVLLATDTTSPYSTVWATTSANLGARTITAKAYDAAGNSTTSAGVTVTVTAAPTPAQPPYWGLFDWGAVDWTAPMVDDGFWGLLAEPVDPTATVTYYVSPTGSDSNDGLASGTPWQTLAKVNATAMKPGDTVLLQGGQSFTGPLQPSSNGAVGAPITFGSYGVGRATVTNTGAGHGCLIGVRSHIVIDGINFTGPGAATSTGNGVQMSHATSTRPTDITVRNSNLTGWKRGVSLEFPSLSPVGTGYDNVLIEDCVCSSNRDHGVGTFGFDELFQVGRYPHTNVTVRRVQADSNAGNALGTGYPSGNGIQIGGVNGGLVTLCRATNNGQSSDGGPVGIWAFDSNAVTIEKCISYSNGTNNFDGGGFDLDINCTGCTIQYCLAYGNEAYGLLLYQDPDWGVQWNSNVVRWNIFWGNSTVFANYGEITISGTGVGSCDIYGNTLVAKDNAGNTVHPPALGIGLQGAATVTGVKVRNNIFKQLGSGLGVSSATAYTAAQVLMQGNAYDKAGALELKWGGVTHTTLAAFRAAVAGQEQVSGVDSGVVAATNLVSPSTAPTVTDPNVSRLVTGVRYNAGSPVQNVGLDLQTAFSVNPGTVDYEGSTLAVPYSIGAIK